MSVSVHHSPFTDKGKTMLNLKKPNMSDMTFRRELSSELDYLADSGRAYIEIKCRAGGYLNPELQKLNEQIDLRRNVLTYSMIDIAKDREKYAKASSEMAREIGEMRFKAFYDACVVEWSTNIQNEGGPMKCDRDHFLALADAGIDEISDYFVEFTKYVDEVSNFIHKSDEETEKN